jgi:tRNA(Met) C34 N-acetyltransferase TmcA
MSAMNTPQTMMFTSQLFEFIQLRTHVEQQIKQDRKRRYQTRYSDPEDLLLLGLKLLLADDALLTQLG